MVNMMESEIDIELIKTGNKYLSSRVNFFDDQTAFVNMPRKADENSNISYILK